MQERRRLIAHKIWPRRTEERYEGKTIISDQCIRSASMIDQRAALFYTSIPCKSRILLFNITGYDHVCSTSHAARLFVTCNQ